MPKTNDSITDPLKRKFSKHRIIFWYDDDSSMRKEFDAVELDGVEKVEIDNNEFGLKYQVCLLYTSPSPRDLSTSRMPSSA